MFSTFHAKAYRGFPIFFLVVTVNWFCCRDVLAVDGVACTESGATYNVCASGLISKLTYRKSTDSALVNGVPSPGCGTGWFLQI